MYTEWDWEGIQASTCMGREIKGRLAYQGKNNLALRLSPSFYCISIGFSGCSRRPEDILI